MKARTMSVGVCAAVFVSLFSSATFAQVSQVFDRGDIAWTDSIDWSNSVSFPTYPYVLDTDTVTSTGGVAVNVAQSASGSYYGVIVNDASFRLTNFPAGNYYSTNVANNITNPVTFSDFDGTGICSFGTQIAPWELGGFKARIEAFNVTGELMGYFDVDGSDQDTDAAFLGLESTDPISYVSISVSNTGDGGGSYASYFALNKVDFNACVSEPEVPALSCDGFAAPMANYPVTAKKNRAFPLKMELFYMGVEQTDVELAAAPVVTVKYTSEVGEPVVDISEEVIAVGQGSDGNQFDFTDEGIWQFNLKSKNLASGTYDVTVSSGDVSEYVIDGTANCHTIFIIN